MPEPMRWFPFYPDRFLTSKRVRRMDAERVGVYWLLLIEQWDNGAIGDQDEDLALVGRAAVGVVREVLAACFKKTRKGWINDALEDVRRQQHDRAERLSRAGKIAGYRSAEARAKRSKIKGLERSLNDRQTVVNEPSTIVNQENRIEENRSTDRGPRARSRAPTWRFVPDGWKPTEKHTALAAQLHVNLAAEEAKFRDHEFKDPKSDADRAFSRWLRTAPQYANGKGASVGREPMLTRLPPVPWKPSEPEPEHDPEVAAAGLALVREAAAKAARKPGPTRRQLSREEQLAIARGKNQEGES